MDAEEPSFAADPHVPEDDLVTPLGKKVGKIPEHMPESEEGVTSSSSSSASSEADNAEENILDEIIAYERILMVTGVCKTSWIHVADLKRAAESETLVVTKCGARPRRQSATFKIAAHMKGMDREFCPRCTSEWPVDIRSRICDK